MVCAFELEQLQVTVSGKRLLDVTGLSVPSGRLTAIIGPNGAGKSTLLRALAGFHGVGTGKVWGQSYQQAPLTSRQFAWVGQHAIVDTPLSVRDYVTLGRRPYMGWFGQPDKADQQAVGQALAAMELQQMADLPLTVLSGGARQRAAIARGLAQQAKGMLLDEPGNHLDIRHQHLLMQQLHSQAGKGQTIVGVLHDLHLAANYADWLVLVMGGKVREQGPVERVMTAELLEEAYQWPICPGRNAMGRWVVDTLG